MASADTSDRRDVAGALARLSAAWQARQYDALEALFDPDIVFALPGGAGRVHGRAAIVESYREFMERATITEYREEPPSIDVWGDTAVATYRWEMAWLAGGVANRESGTDVFVLRRTAPGAWRAVWRTMIVEPKHA